MKKLIVFLSVLVLMAVISVPAFADSAPSLMSNIPSGHAYLQYKSNENGGYRCMVLDDTSGRFYVGTYSSYYTIQATSSGVRYSYNSSNGTWSQMDVFTANGLIFYASDVTPLFSNLDILYPNGTVFFCKPNLVQVVSRAGGQISQAAFQTSSIVLVTACLILAVLLGVSLIPRVVSSFR